MTVEISDRNISIAKNMSIWLIVWLALVVYYDESLKLGFVTTADHVVYIVQLIADITIGTYSYLAYRWASDKSGRLFYLAIFVSIVIGLVSTEVYNLLINLFDIKLDKAVIHELWIIPYTVFLVLQVMVWSLLLVKKGGISGGTKTWVSKLPFIQAAIMVSLSILLTGIFKNSIFSRMELNQIINSILETVVFIVISLCLARTKNKSLTCLAAGFIFLIAFNLAHRLTYMLGYNYKLFDMAWLVCYIVIIFGFHLSIAEKDKIVRFYEENSLHVLASSALIGFTSFVFLAFGALEVFIAILQKRPLVSLYGISENISGVLIFTFMLSVLVSKWVATQFSDLLEKIMRRINLAQKNKLKSHEITGREFWASEFSHLDGFIIDTIGQLQAASKVKSEFLMNMSHDFRTPVSGIYSLSRKISDKLADDGLRASQNLVVSSSATLLNFLDEMLDYTLIESGKFKSSIVEFKFYEAIDEIIMLMQPKAVEKELELVSQSVDTGALYVGDRKLLQRILVNIIGNAIKFTERGSVIVTAKVGLENKIKVLEITVIDTGIGIDEKFHHQIFDPFTRENTIEVAGYPGIGLGLSSTKAIVDMVGGKIFVQSEKGCGSAFTVVLPFGVLGDGSVAS